MPKTQKQYRKGALYKVVGPAKSKRTLKFVGRLKIGKQEYLIFREQRKAIKRRPPKT